VITTRDVEGDAFDLRHDVPGPAGGTSPRATRFLIDDGKLRLRVVKVEDDAVTTRVEVGRQGQ
jgi:hypothetical protein